MHRAVIITEQQVQQALSQFQLAGGKITHIPDQITPRHNLVSSRWDSTDIWMDPANVEPIALEVAQHVLE